jgi:hypothetical protein
MGTPNPALPSRSNELAVFAPRLASRPAPEIAIRKWFVIFAELKREEFTKTFIDLWCEALSDLELEWIEFGCRVYFRSMKFFPMPGDIREIVEEEKQSRHSLALCCRISPAREVEEIEAAIEESGRRHIPAEEILRERREAKCR